MEKIYMEENKKKRKSVIDGTVVLSFVVAIFAIVSLVAFGINQISYADPTPTFEESFTFYKGPMVYAKNGTKAVPLPIYFSDSSLTNPIFCVEHNSQVIGNRLYNVESENGVPREISDNGILYILNKAYNSTFAGAEAGEEKYMKSVIIQTAIWLYLNDTSSNPLDKIDADDVDVITNSADYYYQDDDDDEIHQVASINLYDRYIKNLVTNAKNIGNNIVGLEVPTSTESSQFSEGDDFYQSPEITLTLESNIVSNPNSYKISLDGDVAKDATIVDVDGNPIDKDNVDKDLRKFYVRIPKKNVTEKAQSFTVSATVNFDTLTGYYYVAAELGSDGEALQKVVSVIGANETNSNGVTLSVSGAPDTGMNKVQTIYFIGLIVLLCGVGIIYANAKPVEVKQ